MADVEVRVPDPGKDGPKEATVSFFYVEEGAEVAQGDDLCELVTDKAAMNIQAPVAGKVKKIAAKEEDVVKVDQLLAVIEPK